jgi:hypothetical protein
LPHHRKLDGKQEQKPATANDDHCVRQVLTQNNQHAKDLKYPGMKAYGVPNVFKGGSLAW